MKRDVADSHDYRSYSVTRPEALLDEVYVGLTERFVRFRLSGDVCSPLALPAIVRILRDPRPLYCFSCGPSAQSSSGGVAVRLSHSQEYSSLLVQLLLSLSRRSRGVVIVLRYGNYIVHPPPVRLASGHLSGPVHDPW